MGHYQTLACFVSIISTVLSASTTISGKTCSTSFIYDGTTYTDCTEEHSLPGLTWCGIGDAGMTVDVGASGPTWEYCTENPAPAGCVTDASPAVSCSFPFVYNGISYAECTTVSNGDNAWCSTEPNYEPNRQWGQCNCATCTCGGANKSPTPAPTPPAAPTPAPTPAPEEDECCETKTGSNCVFPFLYKRTNLWYSDCTTALNNDVNWCGTVSVMEVSSGDWALCDCSSGCACGDAAGSSSKPASTDVPACNQAGGGSANIAATTLAPITTVLPTTILPATTPTTTVAAGDCEAVTENGDACVLPFSYRNVEYTECVAVNHNKPWCSLDANYGGRWGNCAGRARNGGQCAPIFDYNGNTYAGCILENSQSTNNDAWCSVDAIYSGNWENCDYC